MKTTQEFIDNFVKIEFIESSQAFGHYPFQLIGVYEDGKMDVGALLLGGDVGAVYNATKMFIKNGCKKIYLSVDFPAGLDVEQDFVTIYTLEDGKIDTLLIPYDETGKELNRITSGKMVDTLTEQFKINVLN
jgi:hypothetical protein